MTSYNNFGVILNLSNFFNDHRHRARIFVNRDIKTVQDLHDKISIVFNIQNFYLSSNNEFLPPSEDIRILHQDEILWVTPIKPDEHIIQQPQTDIIESKNKKKRKMKLENEDQSSGDSFRSKKLKKAKEALDQMVEKLNSLTKMNEDDKKLNNQIQKKSKKNKKQLKTKDTDSEMIDDAKIQSFSNERQYSIKETTKKNRNIDDSFKNNTFSLIKNSPLPTITEQYLKHKKVNIVHINHVNEKPTSFHSADKQESEKIIDNEVSKKQRLLDSAVIEQNTLINNIPPIFCSNSDKTGVDGGKKQNGISQESAKVLEAAKNHLETCSVDVDDNDEVINVSDIKTRSVKLPNWKPSNESCENNFNYKTLNEKHMGEKFFFFKSTPIRKDNSRPVLQNEVTVPISCDKNESSVSKLPENSTSHTEIQELKSHETDNSTKNNPLNGSREKDTPHSETNVGEPLYVEERASSRNATENGHILNSVVQNGGTQIDLDKPEELSNGGDIQMSFEISRISSSEPSKKFPQSKFQLSGIGTLLDELRKADSVKASSQDSTHESDCSQFVTRRRKRVRRRTKKQSDKHETATLPPPVATSPRPMNVKGAPSIHIKFDEEDQVENEVVEVENVIDINSYEEVKTSLQDIMRSPSMINMKPKLGDIIAFKVLKIGPSYQPELSSYITGKVVQCNLNVIVFDILDGLEECKEPEGKFSIKLDGEDNLEMESRQRNYLWSDLIEPRLLYP